MIIYRTLKRQFLTNLIKISNQSNCNRQYFSKSKQPVISKLSIKKTNVVEQSQDEKTRAITRNVRSIMEFYVKQVLKESFLLQNLISICKQLTQQYKRQTHLQFALQRKQIEELLQHLARIQLKDATFEDLLAIIELIIALKKVQNISKPYIQTVKDIIFSKIKYFKQKFQFFSLQKQVRLYCVFIQFSDKQINQLGSIIQKTIISSLEEQNRNWNKILTNLLQVLSKIQKWQPVQQELIQLTLRTLVSKIQKFDDIEVLRTASAINSNHFLILKNTKTFDLLYKSLIQKLKNILQNEIQPKTLKFVLSSSIRQGNYLNKFYKNLYEVILSCVAAKQNYMFSLQNLCNAVAKLKGKHARQQDAAKVVQFFIYALSNKKIRQNLFQKKRCQIYLLQFIQLRYFDDCIQLLDKIITQHQIQIYWSFPFEYSVREVKFPVDVLISKINRGSLSFKQDSNYLKMAVSLAVQTWLHDNQRLQNYFEDVKAKVNSSKFTLNQIQWLIKQYQINPMLARLFHKYYCTQFEQMLFKTYSSLLFSQSKDANKYWIYLLNLCQPNDNFVKKIPFKVIKLIIQRQYQSFQNQNSIINVLVVKKLIHMLKGLQNATQLEFTKNKADFQLIFKQKIVSDLLLWFDRLPNSSKQAAQLYIQLIILILNQHAKESWQMSESFKILTFKLVICNYKIIRETKFFGKLKNSIYQNLKDQKLLQIFENLKERGEIQEGINKQK